MTLHASRGGVGSSSRRIVEEGGPTAEMERTNPKHSMLHTD